MAHLVIVDDDGGAGEYGVGVAGGGTGVHDPASRPIPVLTAM